MDAWFTGFTVREDRTVYLAIHMDGFGEDSNVSGPIAKQIACEILSEKKLAYFE